MKDWPRQRPTRRLNLIMAMDFSKVRDLYKETAAGGVSGAMARQAFAAAISIPILQEVRLTSIARQLFAVEPLGPGAQADKTVL